MLIVVPKAFQFGWMGATRRVFHLAEALRRLGIQVALLAGRATHPATQREFDRRFPGPVIRTSHSGAYPLLLDLHAATRRAWRGAWKLLSEDVYWARLSWGWAERLSMEVLRVSLARYGVEPTGVWGVSAGYLEGAVAAQRLAKAFGVEWIFELHDPPFAAGLGIDKGVVRARFAELLTQASRVVVTAESYAAVLRKAYAIPQQKLNTVHLSYDGRMLDGRQIRQGEFSIVYAGSLSGGRSLRGLISAIAEVFEVVPEARESLKLTLAGAGPGFSEVRRLASKRAIRDSVLWEGRVSEDRVSQLLETAALILVQENKSPVQVPGKLFESLRACKPILGMMAPDCEAARILKESGLGFVHETDDSAGMRDTLIRLWLAWRNGETVVEPNRGFIRTFGVDHLPDKLARVLAGVIELPARAAR